MIIAIDVETTGLNPWKDRLLGLSVSYYDEDTLISTYYPWGGKDVVFPFPWEWLRSPDVEKVGHNLRFDIKFLRINGVEVNGAWEDTKLLAQMLNENQRMGLKPLAEKYIGTHALNHHRALMEHLAELKLTMSGLGDPRVNQHLVSKYCVEDTENTLKLYRLFSQELKKKNPKALEYYYDELIRVERVLLEMEISGNRIDTALLKKAGEELDIRIKAVTLKLDEQVQEETMIIRKELWDLAKLKHPVKAAKGEIPCPPFNWRSNNQKKWLFYDMLSLGKYCHATTETGQPSLSKKDLARVILPEGKLKGAIDLSLQLDVFSKLKSTYVEGIHERLIGDIIHGEYYQTATEEWKSYDEDKGGTKTGRVSHRNPNLGNLHRKQKESLEGFDYYKGSFAKDLFIPSTDIATFIHADYSQIELRVAAHLSKDERFIRAFTNGEDPHTQTATALGISRQHAKTVNFLLIYFGSAKRLCFELGWDPEIKHHWQKAAAIRTNFFQNHPQLYQWIMSTQNKLKNYEYLDSMFGRRRHLPEVNSNDEMKVRHALKQGGNFEVQSAAASICKRAMITLHQQGFKIRNQVHDSITCEVLKEEAEDKMLKMKQIMTNVVTLSIPLEVDCKIISTFKD